MEKNINSIRLMKINSVLVLIAIFCPILILGSILCRKDYNLNIVILRTITYISISVMIFRLFKSRFQKIITEECDYEANKQFLNTVMKKEPRRELVINQINFVVTYLMCGMYAEAEPILNKLNEKMENLKAKTYMQIYILNLIYFAECGDAAGWQNFVDSQNSFQKHFQKLRKKDQVAFSEIIEIRSEILKNNWEKVISLIEKIQVTNEANKVVLSYWYAKAKKETGNQDEADRHFAYVLSHGQHTIYAVRAQEEIEMEVSEEQSVIRKKPQRRNKVVYCISILFLVLSLASWIYIVHFNTSTEDVLKKYNFMVNQNQLERIYSEKFDGYVYEIFVDPKQRSNILERLFGKDIFYSCVFKKQGKYYRLLECYRRDVTRMEPFRNYYLYMDAEEMKETDISFTESYIKDFMEDLGKLSEKEGYTFPTIGVHNQEIVANIEVQGELPQVECVEIKGTKWYIWKYRNINYTDVNTADFIYKE